MVHTYPSEAVAALRPLYDIDSWRNTVELAMIDAYKSLAVVEGMAYLEARLAPEESETVRIAAIEAMESIARAHQEVAAGIARSMVPVLDGGIERERFAVATALRSTNVATIRDDLRRIAQRETSPRVRQMLRQLAGF